MLYRRLVVLCGVILLVGCGRETLQLSSERHLDNGVGAELHRLETQRALSCLDQGLDGLETAASSASAERSGVVGEAREASYWRASLGRELYMLPAMKGEDADEAHRNIDILIERVAELTGASSCA